MTQRRGNARALCVAALCALWPLAAETAVKHALLQPKAKLLCDVSKALKAVAAAAGRKDATIAALEGAATKHAGPLVRAAAAWHTCAASGAEKCSTLRGKSKTAGTLAQATERAAKAQALARQLSAQALGHARRIDDDIRLFAAHSGTTGLTRSTLNKACLVVKAGAEANENIRFANGKFVSGAGRGTPVKDLEGCEETLAEAESEDPKLALTLESIVQNVTQAVNKAGDAQLGAGAFGAGDGSNIATAPCETLTNFAAAATSSPLADSTEVPIGTWWKMTGASTGSPALGITLLSPAKHEADIAAMAAIARDADTEKKTLLDACTAALERHKGETNTCDAHSAEMAVTTLANETLAEAHKIQEARTLTQDAEEKGIEGQAQESEEEGTKPKGTTTKNSAGTSTAHRKDIRAEESTCSERNGEWNSSTGQCETTDGAAALRAALATTWWALAQH
ncbi:hypothetical protein ERJ75_001123900 [Trypanosoma vivax]|nr:hypothetical protein ERJ75_001123900 [Trypanosoma vivax]